MIQLLILLGAVLLGVLLAVCYRLMLAATAHSVESRHRAIERILQSRRPPASWLGGCSRRTRCLSSEKRLALADKTKRDCLVRLERLISYAKLSNLVDDEDTRDALLQQLQEVKERWSREDSSLLLDNAD